MTENKKTTSKHSLRNILLLVGIANLIPAGIIFASVANSKQEKEPVVLSIAPAAGAPGSVVPVDLTIANNGSDGWIAAGLIVRYDGALDVELDEEDATEIRYEDGAASMGLSCQHAFDTEQSSIAFAYGGSSVCRKNGVIGTAFFKIPDDAKPGDTYDFQMEAERFCTRFSGETKFTPVDYTINCGSITVSALSDSKVTFKTLGETKQLSVKTDEAITWTTSDESIAIVDPNGLVTAGRPGTAVITATYGDQTAICNVTVNEYDFDELRGKLNGGDQITTVDAIKVLKASAASMLQGKTGLTPTQEILGDVNEDNRLDTNDAVLILKYYANNMTGNCSWDDILTKK